MNEYMQMAIEEPRIGIHEGHGGPFGAVIVKDGKVIAKGHNRVLEDNNPTHHGEMAAIHFATQALGTYDLTGCELYTTGEPCHMCLHVGEHRQDILRMHDRRQRPHRIP